MIGRRGAWGLLGVVGLVLTAPPLAQMLGWARVETQLLVLADATALLVGVPLCWWLLKRGAYKQHSMLGRVGSSWLWVDEADASALGLPAGRCHVDQLQQRLRFDTAPCNWGACLPVGGTCEKVVRFDTPSGLRHIRLHARRMSKRWVMWSCIDVTTEQRQRLLSSVGTTLANAIAGPRFQSPPLYGSLETIAHSFGVAGAALVTAVEDADSVRLRLVCASGSVPEKLRAALETSPSLERLGSLGAAYRNAKVGEFSLDDSLLDAGLDSTHGWVAAAGQLGLVLLFERPERLDEQTKSFLSLLMELPSRLAADRLSLRECEAQLRLWQRRFELSPTPTVVTRGEWIVEANNAFLRLMGLDVLPQLCGWNRFFSVPMRRLARDGSFTTDGFVTAQGESGLARLARTELGDEQLLVEIHDVTNEDLLRRQNEYLSGAVVAAEGLARRQVAAQRRRVVAALHNDVLQRVAALRLRTVGSLSQPDRAVVSKQFDELIAVLRGHLAELHPVTVDLGGLAVALDRACEQLRDRGLGVSSTVVVSDIPDDMVELVYRVSQELLTNVAEHARARNVEFLVGVVDNDVVVTVEDDGVGFDPKSRRGVTQQHFGLHLLEEAVASVGGSLQLDTSLGRGTQVHISLPVNATQGQ